MPSCGRTLLAAALGIMMSGATGHGQDSNTRPYPSIKDAVNSMEEWLEVVDKGRFEESWDGASKEFQSSVTMQQWVAALDGARKPLGAIRKRRLVSAVRQSSVPEPNGKILKGDFVIAQFETSFANLKYALETVTFQKESDGTWRASGYYVRPRS